MTSSPVLFLIFNRPGPTSQVFEAIRAARPARLYVAADGPRPDRDELAKCEAARQIATSVDWPCDVKLLFRDENLGCKRAVARAIDWFFAHEERGIILEDDCLPDPSFFPYCDELLERYASDDRIMSICGSNTLKPEVLPDTSYFFSRHTRVWGWATWRRAWALYDAELESWPFMRDAMMLYGLAAGDRQFVDYWTDVLDRTAAGLVDTWDYQWMFSCWANSGLAIRPHGNLISNLGFGEDATHTMDPNSSEGNRPRVPMALPLVHPKHVVRDVIADHHTQIGQFSKGRKWTIYRRIRLRLALMGFPDVDPILELRGVKRMPRPEGMPRSADDFAHG